MQYITESQARRLATQYMKDPEFKYIIYNIRERSYKLQNFYKFYFRFSRRESVWNTPLFNIEEFYSESLSESRIANAIMTAINERVKDTIELKLKRSFTTDDCKIMMNYYLTSKCYLAYYDYYLGRVVLIKERDKTNDFNVLVGTRYHFIGDLHDIITQRINIDPDKLMNFMSIFMNEYTPTRNINGFNELTDKVHGYLVKEIEKLDQWLDNREILEHTDN